MDHFLDMARSYLLFRHCLCKYSHFVVSSLNFANFCEWIGFVRTSRFERTDHVSLVHKWYLIYTYHACHRGQTFHWVGVLELVGRSHQYSLPSILLFECYWWKYGPYFPTFPTRNWGLILRDALKRQSLDCFARTTLVCTTPGPHFHVSPENILPNTYRCCNVPTVKKPEIRILGLWRRIQA